MKFTKNILASAVLLATSSLAIAATDITTIEINVTKDAYVNFIGNLTSNPTLSIPVAAIGPGLVIGTLGVESNTSGTCDVAMSTANNFLLVHTTVPSLDLGTYNIVAFGHNFVAGNTTAQNTTTMGNCNVAVGNVVMNGTAVPLDQDAGTYSDTITMTVTTQ